MRSLRTSSAVGQGAQHVARTCRPCARPARAPRAAAGCTGPTTATQTMISSRREAGRCAGARAAPGGPAQRPPARGGAGGGQRKSTSCSGAPTTSALQHLAAVGQAAHPHGEHLGLRILRIVQHDLVRRDAPQGRDLQRHDAVVARDVARQAHAADLDAPLELGQIDDGRLARALVLALLVTLEGVVGLVGALVEVVGEDERHLLELRLAARQLDGRGQLVGAAAQARHGQQRVAARHGHGHRQADDRDDDHQLDEGEALKAWSPGCPPWSCGCTRHRSRRLHAVGAEMSRTGAFLTYCMRLPQASFSRPRCRRRARSCSSRWAPAAPPASRAAWTPGCGTAGRAA